MDCCVDVHVSTLNDTPQDANNKDNKRIASCVVAPCTYERPLFRRNISPPSSGRKLRKAKCQQSTCCACCPYLLVSFLAHSSILKVEATYSCETSGSLRTSLFENAKSNKYIMCLQSPYKNEFLITRYKGSSWSSNYLLPIHFAILTYHTRHFSTTWKLTNFRLERYEMACRYLSGTSFSHQ
jgi:hypothetical protein